MCVQFLSRPIESIDVPFIQIYASLGTIFASISAGMVIGYSAILLPEIQRTNSRIQITSEQASWIGMLEYSLNCLVFFSRKYLSNFSASIATPPMAFGCLFGGILMDRFGRKIAHLMLNVLFVVSWCIVSMSTTVTWLLFGRFACGFCVGLLSPPGTTYLSEISDPKYRGFFLASITFAVSLGVMLTHVLAIFMPWNQNAIACSLLPFGSYILITFAPESPAWLLRSNRHHKAFAAFSWLRGTDEVAVKEFERMADAQSQQTGGPQLNDAPNDGNLIRRVHEWFGQKAFRKPLIIISLYFATLQFSGANAVTFYTVTILKESLGDRINEYTATIIIDSVRLMASIIACVALKNIGRRPLTMFSGIGTVLCLFGLSFYLHVSAQNVQLKESIAIPLILFASYILVLSIGLNPLPWCLTGELFPLRFRAFGSSVVTFFNFLCFFAVVKTSPTLFTSYGSANIFFLYGVLTLVGTVLLIVLLPETRNKSLQEIEDNYTAKRIHKISRNKVQP